MEQIKETKKFIFKKETSRMERVQLHSVSFAEFDIDVGNTLTFRYPPFKLEEYDDEYLGNCCLPDGGHIHQQDRTFMILNVKNVTSSLIDKKKGKKTKKKKKEDTTSDDEAQEMGTLYGVGYFISRNDPTVKRGAIQKAMLILSYYPYFELFHIPAIATLNRYLDDKSCKEGKTLLKNFFDAVQAMEKTQNYQLQLYNESYPINVPVLEEDEFEGASLIELINHFQLDTIIIWYSMLLQKRLLFVGQPARQVGNCCLAAPLLVAPIKGWSKIITPYVALTDISPVMKKAYICGSTNLLFETKTEWWDALGSFSTGCVVNNFGIRSSGRDREFMKNIISGINDARSEEWVRHQFLTYTLEFLMSFDQSKNLRKEHRRHLHNFHETQLYANYKEHTWKSQKEVGAKKNDEEDPTAIFKQLQESVGDPDSDRAAQIKMLYSLSTKLQDLTKIEEICNLDGVATVAAILNESNSNQMRKYAVSVLAQLALSLSGQIAMMSDDVLRRVFEMLNDEMLNVASAACYCILKISTLYIGVQTLVSHDVTGVLSKLLMNPESNLVLKQRCTNTLIKVFTFCPSTPVPGGLPKYLHSQLKSPDKTYKRAVLQLLDLWEEELPQIPISPSIQLLVDTLQTLVAEKDNSDRITASMHSLQSHLVKSPELRLDVVEAGGVEAILENVKTNPDIYSFAILSIIADSNFGRKKILRYRIIESASQLLQQTEQNPLLLFNVSRFLEVCSQHKETGAFFTDECSGVNNIIQFLFACHSTDKAVLCIPALGCLRYLIFFNPSLVHQLREERIVNLLYEMLNGNTEIGGNQSGNRKLKELSWCILRICSES